MTLNPTNRNKLFLLSRSFFSDVGTQTPSMKPRGQFFQTIAAHLKDLQRNFQKKILVSEEDSNFGVIV